MDTAPSPTPASPPKWWEGRLFKRYTILLSLALGIIILYGVVYHRWHPDDWAAPVFYHSDSIFYMAMLKHAQNGDLLPFGYLLSDRIGAPFVGNLNDFPLAELSILWFGGMLSRVTGLVAATNILVIIAHIIAAFSFYTAARLWRVSKPYAWSLSLPYSFIPYASWFGNGGLPFLFFGLLPIQLYTCWYISIAPKLRWRDARFKLALFIALASGLTQIYLIIPFIQIAFFSILRRLFLKKKDFIYSIIPLTLVLLVTAISLSGYVIYWFNYGKNSDSVLREYSNLEFGALKPIDLILPSKGQAFGLLDFFIQRYQSGGATILSEFYRAYIGLLGTAGLIVMAWSFVYRGLSRRPLPLAALVAIWFLIYSITGGTNAIISLLADTSLIRTTVRYTVVISAASFLCLSFTLSRATRSWPPAARLILSLSLGIVGIVDQTRNLYAPYGDRFPAAVISQKIKSDQELGIKLESTLPAESMIFMLPVMDFPESLYIHELVDYELLRPFLHTNTLRFSHGSNKGRPEADWQHNTASRPLEKAVAELESYGFSAILINRKAYTDAGNSILQELEEAGYPIGFEHDNEWVFISLSPSSPAGQPTLAYTFSGEWYTREYYNGDMLRWAKGAKQPTSIEIHTKEPGLYKLTSKIGVISPRALSINLNKKQLAPLEFTSTGEQELVLIEKLKSPINTLEFFSNQSPVRIFGELPRHLSFYVKNPLIEKLDSPEALFSDNWHIREGTDEDWWRWADEKAAASTIVLYSNTKGLHELSITLGSISPRKIVISLNGEIIKSIDSPGGELSVSLPVSLYGEQATLSLSTDQPGVRPGGKELRSLSFYVKNLRIRSGDGD